MTLFPLARLLPHPILQCLLRWSALRQARDLRRIQSLIAPHLPPDTIFLQIGAHDGRQGDPIHDLIRANPGWHGVFVEPIPALYDRLRANYGSDPRFRFRNVAIAEARGDAVIHQLSEAAGRSMILPGWHDQLASLDRDHILKHLGPAAAPFIEQVRVQCLSLADLLAESTLARIDLLVIDTEGHDYRILKQMPFERIKPRAIVFEHKHLRNDEKRAARALLRSHGYRCGSVRGDTVAIG